MAAMVIQSAGGAPEVNLRITLLRKYVRDPPWLSKPVQTSPEVQNRGIVAPLMDLFTSIFLKKQKKTIFYIRESLTRV